MEDTALPNNLSIRGTASQNAPMLVELISEVPGFTPPNQIRSSEKTHAIITATLELLRERGPSNIRMQDIAQRAGFAVTAIYSRFADRNVLYSAIHMLQLEECRPLLDDLVKVENFEKTGFLGLATAFVDVNEFYFNRNSNFVIAQLRSEADTAYRVTYDIMDAYARRFAEVAAVLMDLSVDDLIEPMKLAIHSILAIYRDSVLGSNYFQRPSRDMLAQIFTFIVERQMQSDIDVKSTDYSADPVNT